MQLRCRSYVAWRPGAATHAVAELHQRRAAICRVWQGQCEFVVGQSASGDEVCVRVATGALRKLSFQANFSGRKGASGSRLRARGARANSGGRAVARRAATFW